MSKSEPLISGVCCYYEGCVATWRHWHGFLPGGWDNPDDPEGVPLIFEGDDPDPNAVRDYNGAVLRTGRPPNE